MTENQIMECIEVARYLADDISNEYAVSVESIRVVCDELERRMKEETK